MSHGHQRYYEEPHNGFDAWLEKHTAPDFFARNPLPRIFHSRFYVYTPTPGEMDEVLRPLEEYARWNLSMHTTSAQRAMMRRAAQERFAGLPGFASFVAEEFYGDTHPTLRADTVERLLVNSDWLGYSRVANSSAVVGNAPGLHRDSHEGVEGDELAMRATISRQVSTRAFEGHFGRSRRFGRSFVAPCNPFTGSPMVREVNVPPGSILAWHVQRGVHAIPTVPRNERVVSGPSRELATIDGNLPVLA